MEVEWCHAIRLSVLPGSRAGRASPGAARGADLRSENWRPFLESCFRRLFRIGAPRRPPSPTLGATTFLDDLALATAGRIEAVSRVEPPLPWTQHPPKSGFSVLFLSEQEGWVYSVVVPLRQRA